MAESMLITPSYYQRLQLQECAIISERRGNQQQLASFPAHEGVWPGYEAKQQYHKSLPTLTSKKAEPKVGQREICLRKPIFASSEERA